MGLDILIPVLARPQNVKPLLESLEVTETPHRTIFLCSPHDKRQIEVCRASGVETWVMDFPVGSGDFAKKINYGYEHTESEWLFQGADDVKFYPGWDTAALQLGIGRGKSVVGTNDMHNPQVRRGLGSTHSLFSRAYIETHGGTLDDTGKVFCEEYDHQYVDNEFTEVAKRRGEWIFCRASIVEHLHPAWGLSDYDKTYKKATRSTMADYRLFQYRMGYTRRMTREARVQQRMRVKGKRR